ncbi:ATP-binding protein [Candidatus Pacearchaeota archaeon]|nr:ATP-binding protein [Candidatus Pacearchaeota archaeon]
MLKVVIDGGPGTGKTSVIQALSEKKYLVEPEAARIVLHRRKRSKQNHYIFFDRGLISSISYFILNKFKITKKMESDIKETKYDCIFIVHPLPRRLYVNDEVRRESYANSIQIHKKIVRAYKKYGYKPILVPFGKVKQRTDFILNRLERI